MLFLLVLVSAVRATQQDEVTDLRQHELCLQSLNESTADSKAQFWKQPSCQNYSALPYTCLMGRGRHGDMSIVGKSCERSIWDRKSLFVDTNDALRYKIMLKFVLAIIDSNYEVVVINGDSVAMQLGHFVGCDFYRYQDRFIIKECHRWHALRDGGNTGCIEITEGEKTVQVKSYQVKTECLLTACPQNETRSRVAQNLLSNYLPPAKNALYIYNQGLHVTEKFYSGYPEDYLAGMADGLLSLGEALEKNNSTIMFRETTHQHFLTPSGLYPPSLKCDGSSNPFSCGYLSSPHMETSAYPTDILLHAFLQKNNPQWEEVVGWVPLNNWTWHHTVDMHIERGDCGHFIYSASGHTLTIEFMRAVTMALHRKSKSKSKCHS
jgi:hypothetical protein